MRSHRVLTLLLLVALLGAVLLLVPPSWLPLTLPGYYYTYLGESAYREPPASKAADLSVAEPFCPEEYPADWRKRQVIDDVTVEESPVCHPDNPWEVAAFVKGTNNVSMDTLMKAGLTPDAVVKENDRDGDGDPDVIHIRLEVVELNGRSPDIPDPVPAYAIAPGIQPGIWVFAPKASGMATKSVDSIEAQGLLRVPSPVIRVEQGDTLMVTLENTHYFPHTIHFHGVDIPYQHDGHGNDGSTETSELPVMPGKSHTYVMTPRHPGTMFYHCHVQHHVHFLMGLQGMFVVEENRPNNWVQTLNVGAGHVRHPSVAVREVYDQEYDLHYQDMDRTLHELVRTANDPRLIAKAMRLYDITDDAPDYFLLNGRSFPYTLRESLVVVEPNENVKLRVLNGGEHGISLHPHGHKVTITHYDGVEHNPAAQITRDVIWLSSAQRVDLHLKTVNDGLHSNGEGAWMLHDHKETGVTTDGIYPGGNVSLIVYRSFLDGNAMPKTHGIDLKFFNAKYYDRKVPVWATYDEGQMLSDVVESRPLLSRMILLSFVVGLLLGGFACVVRSARKRSMR